MFPDGSASEIKHGFVGIETAELLRQRATVAKFRKDHLGEYDALVAATVQVKRAHQALEAAKAAARSLPTGLPMSDLLDEVEREARAKLSEGQAPTEPKADSPTGAQLEQKGSDVSAQAEPAKKGPKAA